ncbi:STE/STE20/FRAY protein kinase, variant 1 [Phytophthora nicotianae INRA-310]|uniref:STE/STE20/FRAY protein kinase n=1 Tax=Phytophthora nicotianae (strain INRA-310) TaxID=761204 RepID=W2QZU3_PHYN3|nr:STE/STE20/FRAY protein kinase [Phytophthora nicotianae INRA-310]XP_008896279.1 STE/STE20/FRAY protein kinase, variant 1 [Phytophthora nicotianae INRA-310]ETN18637.1 STE/STE20/FRAY protein kinase [Phytophthora nicotianae INRA-310]ETN18638.1 STE/STE20/FRAY protein kinase, variant 1 [Phytophthora nicotianae INRA-310]
MADEWPTVASEYQIIEQIGQGAFAKVWKAYCAPKKIHVAIKIMDLEKITTSFEDIRAEVQTMKMTNHPNVLKCYCSFVHKDQLWLVTQLMNKGSCLHVMNLLKKKGLGEGLKEEFVVVILHETLKGLQYFHENGQIHRDIKAGNILLDSEGHVVIADFGVSGWMMEGGDRRKNRQTFVGTPCWMAPEVMEQVRGYDYKADIWSLGITALELAKGYAPYARFQPMKVLLLTLQEDPPSLRTYDDDGSGHQFGRHFKDVVKLCLQKDPSKRPGTSALLKHSFFKKAGDTTYLARNLLNNIEDIGESCMTAGIADALPGAGPLYAKGTKGPPGSEAEGSKYVPGTTWVFDDEEDDASKMSIDDFASQFDMVTGGEEFRSK